MAIRRTKAKKPVRARSPREKIVREGVQPSGANAALAERRRA